MKIRRIALTFGLMLSFFAFWVVFVFLVTSPWFWLLAFAVIMIVVTVAFFYNLWMACYEIATSMTQSEEERDD